MDQQNFTAAQKNELIMRVRSAHVCCYDFV